MRTRRRGTTSTEYYKVQVEKGTFSPLVFTTTGGMGPEATRFLKRVAVKLAAKTREKYSDVMNNIRTRISFEILRSVLVAVRLRGVRGKIRQMKVDPISTGEYSCRCHGLWTRLTVLFVCVVSLTPEPRYLPTIWWIWYLGPVLVNPCSRGCNN